MTLGNLIDRLTQINNQPRSNVNYDIYVREEAVIARALLSKLIETLSVKNRDEALTGEDIGLVDQLLSDRWDRIKDNDASYFVSFNNPANTLYIEIAKELSLITKRYWLAHLIPSLNPKQMCELNESQWVFFRNFMNEDFTRLLKFREVFEQNVGKIPKIPGLQFTFAEAKLVEPGKHGKRSQRDVSNPNTPTAISYGFPGRDRLKARVNALGNYLYPTKEALFEALEKHDRSTWLEMMQGLSIEKMTALLLDDDKLTLAQAINQLQVTRDDAYHHGMLFAYTTLFIEKRKQGWEYGNIFLTPVGVVGGVYGKTAKLEAAEVLRSYLQNQDHSLAHLEDHIKTLDPKLQGPMSNGVLSALKSKFVVTPIERQNKVLSV